MKLFSSFVAANLEIWLKTTPMLYIKKCRRCTLRNHLSADKRIWLPSSNHIYSSGCNRVIFFPNPYRVQEWQNLFFFFTHWHWSANFKFVCFVFFLIIFLESVAFVTLCHHTSVTSCFLWSSSVLCNATQQHTDISKILWAELNWAAGKMQAVKPERTVCMCNVSEIVYCQRASWCIVS